MTEFMFEISGCRRDIDEICALLGYYAPSNGNPLPTFRNNVPLKIGPIRCPETTVKDYHSTLRNTPAERRSPILCITHKVLKIKESPVKMDSYVTSLFTATFANNWQARKVFKQPRIWKLNANMKMQVFWQGKGRNLLRTVSTRQILV
jgi:hypothetical protein